MCAGLMRTTPEPKDKLETMTMQEPTSVGECAVMVNGPEDDILNWYAIDWRTAEDDVRRLRQRIFTGLLEPDAVKVARPGSEGGRAQQCARPTRHGVLLGGFLLWAVSVSRSTSLPLVKVAPARTSGTRCGALTARHRACADSMSLNAIAIPAARDPGPLVTR